MSHVCFNSCLPCLHVISASIAKTSLPWNRWIKTQPCLQACYIFIDKGAHCLCSVPVNSKTAHPPPRAIPGHLTRVKLRTVGNLTQNEPRPVGHLTFVSKRLSAVGNKRISQFFDSAREPRSRVIVLVDTT